VLHINVTGNTIHLFDLSDGVTADEPEAFCGVSFEETAPANQLGYDPDSIFEVLQHNKTCDDCAELVNDYLNLEDGHLPDSYVPNGDAEAYFSSDDEDAEGSEDGDNTSNVV